MDIFRILKNEEFIYYQNSKRIINKDTLERIKKLHIPPKWINVKISNNPEDYLQVTGHDSKGRTQYIYHPLWNALVKVEKYQRMKQFMEKLPSFLGRINKKLNERIQLNDKEYIIALLFRIMNKTYSRVGNDYYADTNKTYGLTTLLKKHVTISNDIITFNFIGKKNIRQLFRFNDKLISLALKELQKIPGDRLFKTTNGEYIRSTDMNEYIKLIMGGDFSVKDFRTYASNNLFLNLLLSKEIPTSVTAAKKLINNCYDEVAKRLGHTRNISRSSYVMPIIAEQYLENPVKFKNNKPSLKKILEN